MSGTEQCVRLFLSADIVGSTAYKSKVRDNPTAWVEVFQNFYYGFPKTFERTYPGLALEERRRPNLLKTLGDELLLQTLIESSDDAQEVVRFFSKALCEYASRDLPRGELYLKGTAWIAGFPINNHAVKLEREAGAVGAVDFLGPSIDCGFRIARFATPSRMAVSVDLALLLLGGPRPVDVYFDGTEPLKGVLDGKPYPRLWCKVEGPHPALDDAELLLRDVKRDHRMILEYCKHYVESCGNTWLIKPYFPGGLDPNFNEPPQWHLQHMQALSMVDKNNESDDPINA